MSRVTMCFPIGIQLVSMSRELTHFNKRKIDGNLINPRETRQTTDRAKARERERDRATRKVSTDVIASMPALGLVSPVLWDKARE